MPIELGGARPVAKPEQALRDSGLEHRNSLFSERESGKLMTVAWARLGMLTIRESQMQALDEHALEDFFRRACGFLREFARDDVAKLDDARLLDGVRASYAMARSHGVVGEQGVMRWMCLQIMAGGRFYELPDVAELLASGRPADDVLREIYDRLAVLEIRRGKPG